MLEYLVEIEFLNSDAQVFPPSPTTLGLEHRGDVFPSFVKGDKVQVLGGKMQSWKMRAWISECFPENSLYSPYT